MNEEETTFTDTLDGRKDAAASNTRPPGCRPSGDELHWLICRLLGTARSGGSVNAQVCTLPEDDSSREQSQLQMTWTEEPEPGLPTTRAKLAQTLRRATEVLATTAEVTYTFSEPTSLTRVTIPAPERTLAPAAAEPAGTDAAAKNGVTHEFLITIATACTMRTTRRATEKAARFRDVRLTLRSPDVTAGGLEFGAGQQTVHEETIDGYRIQVQAFDGPPPPGVDPAHASREPEQLVVDGFGVDTTDLPWISSRDPVTLAFRRLVPKVTVSGTSAERLMPAARLDLATTELEHLRETVQGVLYRAAAAMASTSPGIILPGREYPAADQLGVAVPAVLDTLPGWYPAIGFGAAAEVRRSERAVISVDCRGENPTKPPEDRAESTTLAYALATGGTGAPAPVEDDRQLHHARGNPLWNEVPQFVRMHPVKSDDGPWPEGVAREGTDSITGPRVAGMKIEIWTKTGGEPPKKSTVKTTVILPSPPDEYRRLGIVYDPAEAVRLAILPTESDGPDPSVLARLTLAAYGPPETDAGTIAWLQKATVVAARRTERERRNVYPTLRATEEEAAGQLSRLAPENHVTTITIDKRLSHLWPGDGIARVTSRTSAA